MSEEYVWRVNDLLTGASETFAEEVDAVRAAERKVGNTSAVPLRDMRLYGDGTGDTTCTVVKLPRKWVTGEVK